MASILDKYGIKEVADVTFYELDDAGAPSAPVLFLDTLKVSTIEQAAEQSEAKGGKGNPPLIIWDYGRDITVTLEDALFSTKSMAIMFGGSVTNHSTKQEVLKTVPATELTVYPSTETVVGYKMSISNNEVVLPLAKGSYYKYTGSSITPVATPAAADAVKKQFDYVTFDLLDCTTDGTATVSVTGLEIRVDAGTFPGTYYITGDTFARNQNSGKDEFFQFIIPKAKIQSDGLTLTMEAEGDPSTFSMKLRVLRGEGGQMMKLVKYSLTAGTTTTKNMGVGSVLSDYDDEGVENAGYTDTASKVTDSGANA